MTKLICLLGEILAPRAPMKVAIIKASVVNNTSRGLDGDSVD